MVLPMWLNDFQNEECVPSPSGKCDSGGRLSLLPFNADTVLEIDVAQISLPMNGVLELADGLSIMLHDIASPVVTTWVDRNMTWQDFNCPNNWAVSGTNSNPDFRNPCYRDIAVFPDQVGGHT